MKYLPSPFSNKEEEDNCNNRSNYKYTKDDSGDTPSAQLYAFEK